MKWYLSLCGKAALRANTKKEAKLRLTSVESHHILPKGFKMGGENEDKNLVHLTSKEHFIAHLCLVKVSVEPYRGKMLHALVRMARTKKISGRGYEKLRKEHCEWLTKVQTGKKKNPYKPKTITAKCLADYASRRGVPVKPSVLVARIGKKHKHEVKLHPVHSCIDVQATISKYDYDPRLLTLQSNKRVVRVCEACGVVQDRPFYAANRGKGRCFICNSKVSAPVITNEVREKMSKGWTPERRRLQGERVALINKKRATRQTQSSTEG